ncbi:MAG: hypothetical protein QW648_00685 [Nanoarchaeales archaeon]
MINKRFQKILFLLLVITIFLAFTISSVFSEEKSDKTIEKDYSFIIAIILILAGVSCLVASILIIVIVRALSREIIICLITGLLLIAVGQLSYILLPYFIGTNFFLNVLVYGFLVVISSGALYFLGYVFAKSRLAKYSKHFFDASAIVAFLGIFIIELIILSKYVSVSKFPLEECKGEINFLETQSFFFCVFLGKKPVGEQSYWMWLSFLIFGIILPFLVIFSITFGLFFGMRLDKLFGRYGKPVVSIIAFATAMFGMRQLIGPFLIDLLAYGAWGIFGVMIAFIVASAIRFIGMRFLEDVKHIQESIYGVFKVSKFSSLIKIKDELQNISKTINDPSASEITLQSSLKLVENIITSLEGMSKSKDIEISSFAAGLLIEAEDIKRQIGEKLKKTS